MKDSKDMLKPGVVAGTKDASQLWRRHGPSLRKLVRKYWEPYLLLAPTVLLMFAVLLYPLAYGIQLSFTDKELLSKSISYVGFQNYVKLLADEIFWTAVRNTVVWTFYVVAGRLGLGLALALLLHHIPWGRRVFRTLFLVPWAVPTIVVGIMFVWLLDPIFGYINQYLRHVNLISEPILFLVKQRLVMPTVSVSATWTGYPFAMLAWLAALQAVNQELYDAAAVDGANRWQRFVHITLPSVRSVFVLLLLLEGIWVFNNFEMVYILTRGGPAHLTELLSTYSYKVAFDGYQVSYGATIATVQFVFLLILSLIYLKFLAFREEE